LNDPVVKRKSEATGGYIETSSPAEFAAFMRKEADRWGRALRELGLRHD
jgi:tripartite-type tricarboxylate transporter receptor subunit TctC